MEENYDDWLNYPFPLENGQVARILVPRDLSLEDADRVSRCLEILLVEPYSQPKD